MAARPHEPDLEPLFLRETLAPSVEGLRRSAYREGTFVGIVSSRVSNTKGSEMSDTS
jgi:hypothetical protein